MTESLPTKAKKIFKRLKLGELSLVDDACVPGSDVLVIKARRGLSPDGHESTDKSDRVEGEREPGGAQASEHELIAKALGPFRGMIGQLEASSITVTDFLQRADAEASRLQEETETGGDPVAKSAALAAVAIITESTVTLAELQAAYDALSTRVDAAEAAVTVEKSKAAAAEARAVAAEADVTRLTGELASANEAVTKAKPAPTQAEQDEAVLKALPEHLRTEITQSRERATAAEIEAEVTKAKALGVADPDAVGKAMRTLRAADAAATEVIEKALGAASAVAQQSESIFKAYGVIAGGAGDKTAEDELQAKADDIRKAKPNITAEAAYAEAMEAHPELYGQVVAKRRAGAALVGAN